MKKVWKNPLGFKVYGWRPPTGKKRPRVFDEAKEPLSAGKLKIHRDGSFSIFALHKAKWRWFKNWEVIAQSDFARLSVADRKRIRKFEERTGREVVVRDFDY